MLLSAQPQHLRLPRLRFVKPADPGPGAPGAPAPKVDEPPANFVDEKGREWGFPANTPVDDMTDPQAKEYWRQKAKKHEKGERALRRQAQEDEGKTKPAPKDADADADEQKRIDDARAEGQLAGIRATLPTLIESAILAANPDIEEEDIEDIIDDLDLSKFVTRDGQIDRDRIKKLAEKHAAKTSSENGQAPGSGDPLAQALGHHQQQPGGSSPTGGGSITSLREQARERIKPTKKS